MGMDLPSSKASVDQLHPKEKIRVMIVDDHAVVRQGLRTFLELHRDLSSDDPYALPIEVVDGAQMAQRRQSWLKIANRISSCLTW
jgi:hypothetical protein